MYKMQMMETKKIKQNRLCTTDRHVNDENFFSLINIFPSHKHFTGGDINKKNEMLMGFRDQGPGKILNSSQNQTRPNIQREGNYRSLNKRHIRLAGVKKTIDRQTRKRKTFFKSAHQQQDQTGQSLKYLVFLTSFFFQ